MPPRHTLTPELRSALRKARLQQGWSQVQLGALLGITGVSWCLIEGGRTQSLQNAMVEQLLLLFQGNSTLCELLQQTPPYRFPRRKSLQEGALQEDELALALEGRVSVIPSNLLLELGCRQSGENLQSLKGFLLLLGWKFQPDGSWTKNFRAERRKNLGHFDQEVLQLLQGKHKVWSITEVALAMGWSANQAKLSLHRLEDQGLVVALGTRRSRQFAARPGCAPPPQKGEDEIVQGCIVEMAQQGLSVSRIVEILSHQTIQSMVREKFTPARVRKLLRDARIPAYVRHDAKHEK